MAGINSCYKGLNDTIGAIDKFTPINEEGFDNLFVIK